MPIRIMHVVYGLGRGGLQTGMENLFSRLDRGVFEHVICVLRPPIDHPMCQGLAEYARLMCLATTESRSRFQAAALARAIREVKPDIVHSRNWGCIEAVISARWAGRCAVVHGEHGIDTDQVIGEPRRRAWFRRVAYEMADRVYSVSYQLRELHAARTGYPAGKITVIHNGVNQRRFFPDPDARARVRAELGIGESELCIGSVGNLAPVKDHMTTLRAIAEFSKMVKGWRCLILGEGPERPRLEAFLQGYPEWKDRVSLPGLTRRIPEMLNTMDVLVLSSVTEGICNSLLEAMAAGLPVIATATGGNPEIVVDGQSGLLFPVGDVAQLTKKLLLLAENKDLRLQLGRQAARRMREEFSVEAMARGYSQIYQSLAPAEVKGSWKLRRSGA
jgi:sugar transferase (PEP-CTERM/EpsH1 system associated)